MKEELKNSDLVRTNCIVMHITEEQDHASLVEIREYIQACRKRSDYVEDHWNGVQSFNVTLLTKSLDGSEEWKVLKSYTKDNGTDVIIKGLVPIPGAGSEETHPTCKDCEYFQSS